MKKGLSKKQPPFQTPRHRNPITVIPQKKLFVKTLTKIYFIVIILAGSHWIKGVKMSPDTSGSTIGNIFQGLVRPVRKPLYSEGIPPAYYKDLLLGVTEMGDIRRYTQLKVWIKPPTERWIKASSFLGLTNGNGSTYVRLNSIDELKTIKASIDLWLPEMEKKLDELKTLEQTIEVARRAYSAVLSNNSLDIENNI